LCTLVQVCDGYDIGSIGIAVPALTHAWNLPGPAFTQAFLVEHRHHGGCSVGGADR
jgi:hypothetical protein